MPTLTIDGQEVTVEPGMTILQACEQIGIEIPRFCYHERLSIAGNCRMCLVDVERAPKPVASCAMPVGDGMVVHTSNEKVKKAREGVMEFLLINHPLDCPICDQGGECDLQDQAMAYGCGESRFTEQKRAVQEKEMGPLIRTMMTRCIQCMRCVRFIDEIAGVPVLGGFNRGDRVEVGTYVEAAIDSELSGNLADVCPVGALTHQSAAFAVRPWELRHTESVDVHDAVGSNIRVDVRGREVVRVLPREHDEVNEEWLSDRSRYAVDGLKAKRLDRPWVRKAGKLQQASWQEALAETAKCLKTASNVGAIAGDLTDVEAMVACKDLLSRLDSQNMDCRQDGSKVDPAVRASYLFNSTIAGIDEADAILLVGTNPRWEAALINARIRKRYLAGGLKVANLGPAVDLTYKVEQLGNDPQILKAIADGSHPFAEVLKNAEKPMLILGNAATCRADGDVVLGTARAIADATGMVKEGWNGFNLLQTAASRVGGLEIGFVPGPKGLNTAGMLAASKAGSMDVLFLLGADELDMSAIGESTTVVYVGHHGDAAASRADIILPGAAYTEKDAQYVNTEGRVQYGQRAVFAPGEGREDWTIFRALSDALNMPLDYDNRPALRARIGNENALFGQPDTIVAAEWAPFGAEGELANEPFTLPVQDFYLTNAICRASAVMAECSSQFGSGATANEKATGTNG